MTNTAQALTTATEGYNDAERPIEQARFAKMIELLQPEPEDKLTMALWEREPGDERLDKAIRIMKAQYRTMRDSGIYRNVTKG